MVDCHGLSIDHTGLPSLVSNHKRTMPTTRHFCAIDVPRDDTPFPQETGVVFVPDLPGDDASETTRGVDAPECVRIETALEMSGYQWQITTPSRP